MMGPPVVGDGMCSSRSRTTYRGVYPDLTTKVHQGACTSTTDGVVGDSSIRGSLQQLVDCVWLIQVRTEGVIPQILPLPRLDQLGIVIRLARSKR